MNSKCICIMQVKNAVHRLLTNLSEEMQSAVRCFFETTPKPLKSLERIT
jgi:hypothetical protein